MLLECFSRCAENCPPRKKGREVFSKDWAIGTAWEGVTNDELSDNVQTDLLMGDSLDDDVGNHIDKRDAERKNESVHRYLCDIHLDTYHTEDEHIPTTTAPQNPIR